MDENTHEMQHGGRNQGGTNELLMVISSYWIYWFKWNTKRLDNRDTFTVFSCVKMDWDNNNNNRVFISTIGPTRHSLLVTISFSRLLSASYVLCSTIFACLELQRPITQVWKPLLGKVGTIFKSSGYQLSFKKSRIM